MSFSWIALACIISTSMEHKDKKSPFRSKSCPGRVGELGSDSIGAGEWGRSIKIKKSDEEGGELYRVRWGRGILQEAAYTKRKRANAGGRRNSSRHDPEDGARPDNSSRFREYAEVAFVVCQLVDWGLPTSGGLRRIPQQPPPWVGVFDGWSG